MNRESISFKFRVFLIVIIAAVCFIGAYTAILIYNKNNFYPTVNKGRVLTHSIKVSIEEAIMKKNFSNLTSAGFPYTAVDNEGRVLASSMEEYYEGRIVNLVDFIGYDNKTSLDSKNLVRFTDPLIIDNKQIGTIVFLIPKEQFLSDSPERATLMSLLPIIAAVLIIIIAIIRIYIFSKKDILHPLASLHESARRILKGDFSCKIKYDYDTEMGFFCHDFEAMRDELKFSKEREAAIKANEKELLACLSHDIKTPLTAIHGYAAGIKDGIVKDKTGIDNYCTIILNRVKMLSKLLEDILEHSKAELNKMDITAEEFYCGDFFKGILEDLSVEVESKGLKFIYPEKIPNLLINCDKKRLSQVLYNLASNSIKYSKQEGEISVYFETTKGYLKIYVKDTGIGIASSDVPFIFNKFYRGEKSRNQNIQGSGLGLSISKYIVEAHGGFIECVESGMEGTTMCFGIPI